MKHASKVSLTSSSFESDFSKLGTDFYTLLQPSAISNPQWVSVSDSTANFLGLDVEQVRNDDLDLLSGRSVKEGSRPLSMIYSGHQFGVYNPQLGDGRGILLGELVGQDNELYDLHLKGAGQTPYSRMGDGRAVLRSSIREFLCSDAMSALGIPTTRALSLVKGDDQIIRERVEPSAMVCRVARSHIRFGSFEYFYYTDQQEQLKALLDYTILRYFPLLTPDEDGYLEFYRQVLERTASMVAMWQAVGFCHGVMNTDNMSILGETFDYGPFGFMEIFNPAYICNHSDHSGRYAFNQQPNISYWNCACLGQALSNVLSQEAIKSCLDQYPKLFGEKYLGEMRLKLGLLEVSDNDSELIQNLLNALYVEQLDYTNFFRTLSDVDFRKISELSDSQSGELISWLKTYEARLEAEKFCPQQRTVQCKSFNPKYILRNYLAQIAIEKAEQNDFSEVNRLLQLLSRPFDEQPDFDSYAQNTPEWGCGLQMSCSS
ncbi:YdiU family protein [Litoribrevibacter euphylliae]|uniref:Protein nucleotidyltransferase YdiU n=1 Tax=Litoribrevibacter euphylliae TaxID=1834034 RepID=A0ABV7HHF9_9GAMM